MKRLMFLLFLITAGNLRAQDTLSVQQTLSWEQVFLNAPEVALPKLLEAAIRNSPSIARLTAEQQIVDEKLKLEKKSLLKGLSIGTQYYYGTVLNFYNQERQTSSFNAFDLPAQGQYASGVSLNYSLYDLFSQRQERSIRKLEQHKAEANKKAGESQIRQLVISMYQDIILSKEEMELYQEALQSASLHLKLAEKQFENGELSVSQISEVKEAHASTAIAHRRAVNKYQTAILLLEDIIGMKIMDLMRIEDEV